MHRRLVTQHILTTQVKSDFCRYDHQMKVKNVSYLPCGSIFGSCCGVSHVLSCDGRAVGSVMSVLSQSTGRGAHWVASTRAIVQAHPRVGQGAVIY